MNDMRDTCEEKQSELDKVIKFGVLSETEKKHMLLAMEFGFTTAFCARTCDINESWFAAQQYSDTYQEFKKKLED